MIGYVTLGTNHIAAAQAYYDALLGMIGATRLMDSPEPNGFTMWGTQWDAPGIALTRPYNGQAASPGNGPMIGIPLDDRAKVDAFYARAIELGGSDEGPPGLRGPEGPHAFYGAYFRDPEGNKLCAYKLGPA